MAEFVMKDLVSKEGLADRFHIESAATSAEELGNPVYPGTAKVLREEGIGGFEDKRARQIKRADYEAFDLIIGMDEANIRSLERTFSPDPAGKIHKLLEYAGSNRDVADPWYTRNFRTTYDDVLDGCLGLFHSIKTSR